MEVTTFYIYEVPGIKNGCTTEWQNRSQQMIEKYNIIPVLIETLVYPDTPEYWQIVGDREFELAEKNGYAKNQHYRYARQQRKIGQRIGAPLGGSANTEKQKLAQSNMGKISCSNSNHQAIAGKVAGKLNAAKTMTCQHCNKTGNYMGMIRYHGKNCKLNNK